MAGDGAGEGSANIVTSLWMLGLMTLYANGIVLTGPGNMSKFIASGMIQKIH
jgi:hypothetical protein